MARCFLSNKRGVSEIVASLILVLIVSVAGVALYSYSLGAFSSSNSSFQLRTVNRDERARERISIITVWSNTSTNEMNVTVLNHGKIEAAIDAVYINGSSVFFSESGGRGQNIATGKWVSLKFTYSTQSGNIYEILVVSERGSNDVVYWKA